MAKHGNVPMINEYLYADGLQRQTRYRRSGQRMLDGDIRPNRAEESLTAIPRSGNALNGQRQSNASGQI